MSQLSECRNIIYEGVFGSALFTEASEFLSHFEAYTWRVLKIRFGKSCALVAFFEFLSIYDEKSSNYCERILTGKTNCDFQGKREMRRNSLLLASVTLKQIERRKSHL